MFGKNTRKPVYKLIIAKKRTCDMAWETEKLLWEKWTW